MEETRVSAWKSIAIEDEYFLDNGVLLELKQYCVMLLELIRNPGNDGSFLSQLLDLLRRSSRKTLKPFLDYSLFPLLLLFDGAVNCRSSKSPTSQNEFVLPEIEVSDSVAEGVVLCLEEVLIKCPLGSVNQMVVILKKLANGAMLSPVQASEEFRVGVIRCFRALLLNICPCSDESCPCKQISGWPLLAAEELLHCSASRVSKGSSHSSECLLAFLQSEPAAPAVGHWLSLLLKAVDIEAARGHRGCSEIRVEALVAFRVLIAKVGTPDALAFYLPGVVSQLSRVLHSSKTMISGAAGNTEALNQAIRGLTEYLIVVLSDNAARSMTEGISNDLSQSCLNENPVESVLQELRQLTIKNPVCSQVSSPVESLGSEVVTGGDSSTVNSDSKVLRVHRTVNWFANTTDHVNKLLSATFPLLCIHPSVKVRLGLLASVKGLLDTCCYALKQTKLVLLECLFVMVCDDFEDVSSAAQTFVKHLMSLKDKQGLEKDISEIFKRLLEKLPQVVMGNDELVALSHARKLLAVTYFAGAHLVSEYLVRSPVAATRFLDVFTLCLSQNSTFAGSLNKFAARKPSSSGFLDSISEMKSITNINNKDIESLGFQHPRNFHQTEHIKSKDELPGMPPWFLHFGSQKLYNALAEMLRLVSLYVFTDIRSEGYFPVLLDILLERLRKLVNELRMKQYHDESWQVWYERTGSGNLIRQSSTAVCILNEMIFGLSDRSINSFAKYFLSGSRSETDNPYGNKDLLPEYWTSKRDRKNDAKSLLVDCIGSILHEYLAPEIWDLPLGMSSIEQSGDHFDASMHFFNDNGMLHQVVIEGIGIFNICLGKEFSSCGFLNTSLYLLLENIICSNFHVRRAANSSLHIISTIQNFPTVGHLVLANADYIIDSVCRQLRSLDLNPHVPNVLAAMLSFIGVADKILTLLDEPMHAVSMELEILGRHRHPNLTLPFAKAVAEISKAAKLEAEKLPGRAVLFNDNICSKTADSEKSTAKLSDHSRQHSCSLTELREMQSDGETCTSDLDVEEKKWESAIFEFNDSKRYRKIVGSISASCLSSITPLIASTDPSECLAALDVIEDGISALAKVEEAYKHESKTKEAIEEAVESLSLYNLLDTLRVADDEASENRLLPAANKIWPFLITCFRSKNLVAIKKCCQVICTIVRICGGDFFSRRFLTDGSHIWMLLSSSPFHKRPFSKEDRIPLQLPYRKSFTASSQDPPSEISSLKVQIAVLEMIGVLAGNSRSSPALAAVLKKVSGIVVGIACSGIKGLQDACVNALVGLASLDADLIWLLLADVYYSKKGSDLPSPPSEEFPEIGEVLLPAASAKEFLHVMYGGQTFGFDVDFSAVESVFRRLVSSNVLVS